MTTELNPDTIDLTSFSTEQIDTLMARAAEAKAEKLLEQLEPLRKAYADAVNAIDRSVRPFGLDAHRFITMTPQALRKHVAGFLEVGDEAQRSKVARVRVPPRYRNPENAEQTWTGRGMVPHWVRNFKAAGGTLTDIEIPRELRK